MADVRAHAGDLGAIPSPVVSTFTSNKLINDGRSLWKLKVVVSGSITGTSPTLTPQLIGYDQNGASFGIAHAAMIPITAVGTFWYVFHVDGSDSPVADRQIQVLLVTGGTSPSFGTVAATLYGIRYINQLW